MKTVFLLLISISLLGAQTPSGFAPAPPSQSMEAMITRKSGPPMPERIVAADAAGVSVLMPDGRNVIKLPYDQIEAVRFALPPGWDEIAKSIRQGRVAEVELRMLPIATKMAPMTVIKGGDAARYVFAYTDVLRSLGKYQAALDFLEKTPFPNDAPVVDRARRLIARAYCLATLGKVDEADKLLNQVQAPDDKSSLFTIYQLARARVEAQRKDQISSLDDIAHILAVKRLGSESYDEALYQSAEAYDLLAKALADQKRAMEQDERLQRQMQQDNLDAISRFDLIKSDPLQVAAIWDADYDYKQCALSARLELCRVYPTSPWTARAREKLSDEARALLDEEAGRKAEVKPAASPEPGDKTPKKEPAKDDGILKLDESAREKDGF